MIRETITSHQNSKIKLASKLVSKRQREKSGLFVVDYARDLARALDHHYEVEFAFFCEALASDDDRELVAAIEASRVYNVSEELMSKASYRQNPGGLVAILRQQATLGVEDAARLPAHHVLALVDLRVPGNIGALLRTADAAGIGMICLIDTTLDLYNPNIIRSSTGAVFLNNIVQMTSEEAFAFFEAHNIAIVATHLEGTQSLYDFDFTAQRTAIVLGTEDTGLDKTWANHSDALVKIPMMGHLSDSLNVSVCGAIFMYEALRQSLQQP